MSLTPPPTEIKSSSIFDFADADLIIRTADQVDFRVHRLLMRLTSPVFKDMFDVAAGGSTKAAGSSDDLSSPPLVPAAEESDVFEPLLRYIYPISKASIDTFEMLSRLIDLAEKYDIESARSPLTQYLESDRILKYAPLRVFAIAKRYGYSDIAKAATKYCVRLDLTDRTLLDPPEFAFLSARDFGELHYCKAQRAKLAVKYIHEVVAPALPYKTSSSYSSAGYPSTAGSSLEWWNPMKTRLGEMLEKDPTAHGITEIFYGELGKAYATSDLTRLDQFARKLIQHIDELEFKTQPDRPPKAT